MVKFERVSNKALLLWEILAFIIAGILVTLVLLILAPKTWLWYLILFIIGLAYLFEAFLHLPLYYLNLEFCIEKENVVLRKGVIFPKTDILSRERIAFVTVFNNPLTPLFHISSVIFSAAGGSIYLGLIDSKRAREITHEFNKKVR